MDDFKEFLKLFRLVVRQLSRQQRAALGIFLAVGLSLYVAGVILIVVAVIG